MNLFEPAAGLRNAHLQTILPRIMRREILFRPVTERLMTPDDDFLDLAWTADPARHPSGQPVMILFHGLEGSLHSPYAHSLLFAAKTQGWLGVIMHFRGCSGEINRQARSYHSGETSDAAFFIRHVRERFPGHPLLAVGVSLGGNMLVNYLAETGAQSELTAAQVISPPLDLAACSARIEQGFSRVYQRYLLGSMKRNILKKIATLPDTLPFQPAQISGIRSLRQFDDTVTAPLHGFSNAADYYHRCSGLGKLARVETPLRIIHAADDPFMTEAVIPTAPLPAHIDYHLTQYGGHVGFISGSWRAPVFWLDHTVPAWFQTRLNP
ncbi:hydrolase [Photobacterium sp. GJ3]|uniref:hydrolase n=1 Tax=Photobacterium sp. GJ3 TaxID=2829502 RepID=UPI001B8AF9EE|nr:hydrolase [Photobacterium sp. GJ3]QUJ67216.1 hydrolase [Photobacterium sp. GJ3]